MRLVLSERQRALQADADELCAAVAHILDADPDYRLHGMPSDGDSLPCTGRSEQRD